MGSKSLAGRHLRHEFFSKASDETYWLAGLVAADGCIAGDGSAWTLSQSGDDGHLMIEHVRQLIDHRLTLSATISSSGKMAYKIYVPSARMVSDLDCVYGVRPRKSLNYEWPGLTGDAGRDFLRGYIDGDGCVSAYPTPHGNLALHLSFVGTPEFATGAAGLIPSNGRIRRLPHCKNLSEIRYNGRHAWGAGAWLYANPRLYRSAKAMRYLTYTKSARPPWLVAQAQRAKALELLGNGVSLRETAADVGVNVRTICVWKASQLKQSKDPLHNDREG